jgi:WD40 repeat protein
MDGTARVYAAGDLSVVSTLTGHSGGVRAISFSMDGIDMLGAFVLMFSFSDMHHACFAPAGLSAVTCSQDTTLRVWETATGALLQTLNHHRSWVRCCSLSPTSDDVIVST